MAKNPKFTDKDRFTMPYVESKKMGEGYLAERLKLYREQQEKDEAERKSKLRQMRKA